MAQRSLFETGQNNPLASRLRPKTLEGFVGQRHLLGEGKVLRQLIEQDQVSSMIFWGPPGVGKTTLARIIAGKTQANFIDFSAVTSGIKEIREVMNRAENDRLLGENHPVCGRDSPFQQGAAGCFSAVCGKGQHHPHWCDDRKPFL